MSVTNSHDGTIFDVDVFTVQFNDPSDIVGNSKFFVRAVIIYVQRNGRFAVVYVAVIAFGVGVILTVKMIMQLISSRSDRAGEVAVIAFYRIG